MRRSSATIAALLLLAACSDEQSSQRPSWTRSPLIRASGPSGTQAGVSRSACSRCTHINRVASCWQHHGPTILQMKT